MSFIPHNPEDRRKMLATVGITDEEELFATIPEGLRHSQRLKVPGPLDEETIRRIPQGRVSRTCFAGGGIYRHHIPALVDALAARQEFYTALKRLGVPAEMVIYPRTQHGPEEPKFIQDIGERVIKWFDQYLKR